MIENSDGNERGRADVYVFNPKAIVAHRELNGLNRGKEGKRFEFDEMNQEIRYRTEQGEEVYDLVRDSVERR
jgi:hypothetical protein